MAKKKRKPLMKFYNLRLNEHDLLHLKYALQHNADWQQDMMDSPPEKGTSADEQLEDWVIARDIKSWSLQIIQMIDRVYKPKGKR